MNIRHAFEELLLWTGQRKRAAAAITTMTAISLLAGCAANEAEHNGFRSPMPKKPIILKVVGTDEQLRDWFRINFAFKFHAAYPNVSFQFIKPMNQTLEDLIQQNSPDIIVSEQLDQYADIASAGLVESLDGIIQRDKFDVEAMLPGVIGALKERGGGVLYGLTPWYESAAFVYNTDLFEEKGISPPADTVTWEQLFELASRFANGQQGEEAVYGMAPVQSWTSFLQTIGMTYGFQLGNVDTGRMSINTEQWRTIIGLVAKAIREGSIPPPMPVMGDKFSTAYESPFMKGQAGMSIITQDLMFLMGKRLDGSTFRTSIMPLPIGSDSNAVSPIRPAQIMSVAKGSAHLRAAWEVVKYAAGEEWSMRTGNRTNAYLLSRSKLQADKDGLGLNAFYEGLEDKRLHTERALPDGFMKSFDLKLIEVLQAVADGWLTAAEAAAQLQVEGQVLFDEGSGL